MEGWKEGDELNREGNKELNSSARPASVSLYFVFIWSRFVRVFAIFHCRQGRLWTCHVFNVGMHPKSDAAVPGWPRLAL